MNILLKNATAFIQDEVKQVHLFISQDKIKKIFTDEKTLNAILQETKNLKIIDAKNKFVVPGFVNTHTHASMTLLRSYADDMALMDWLQNKIWPIEDKMRRKDIYWGAMLAALEMIKSGTTTFADMYGSMDQVANVVLESGLRGVLSRGMIGVAPNAEQAFEDAKTLFKAYHGRGDGRITVMFSPHAPYTCPPAFLRRVVEVAKDYKAEIHIHLSETKGEVENCLKDYKKTPIALMEEVSALDCGLLGAHCVWVNDDDIALMKKYNMRVAHNPQSNLKLASGIAPVDKMLQENICVGLGTDGASSNNNLDMLEEIRLAALLHKVNTLNPLAVPAKTALKMGTEFGAKALGLKNLGRIEENYLADLVLFDMNEPEWTPRTDLISLLVYAANSRSVDTVICNGKILMQGKELLTLDEEKILFEAQQCFEKLMR